jgi:hypothetical protein
MEQKAWIDVKSPRFFIWKAIQYVGVIGSGVKLVLSPTNRQNKPPIKITDIRYIHNIAQGLYILNKSALG